MRNILSREERAEYDALLHDAAYENGEMVATNLVAGRAHVLLVNAEKAGRAWAEIVLDRALTQGLRAEVSRYRKRINVTTETDLLGTRARTKVYSISESAPDGSTVWQPKLYEEMTLSDLDQLINGSEAQLDAIQHNRLAAKRLRAALVQTGKPTVGQALIALGQSLEEALGA